LKLGRTEAGAPEAPADYAENAGRTARLQIGKAGLRLAKQLQKVLN
jgi:hypothetical protein